MKKDIVCVAIMLCGLAGGSWATETNSSLAPLISMDVPYVPAQETPIVLAQVDASGVSPQPDFILKDCQETTSIGDPLSAVRGIYPAESLTTYLGNRDHRLIYPETTAATRTILLESTTHGKLVPHTASNGALYYIYEPVPEYEGDDQAVFMAEFEGKRYKIVVVLHVFPEAGLATNVPSTCPAPQLIKVTKPAKPSSGASGFGSGYDLNSNG